MVTKKTAILDIADFHAKVAEGKRPRGAVRLAQPGTPAIAAATERVVSFVFSDGSVDRYGDTIDARGWVLDGFATNPVALFGHDAGSVENVVGKARNVRVHGQQLVGEIEFAEAAVNPNAETVFQMVKAGYLNTVSVGFQPLEWTQTKDKSRPGGIDFKKQELLEISIVPIPANPNAVALARAAGLDVDRLKLVEAAPARDEFKISKKGLYSVSSLASILAQLGWLEDDVEWEAEYEGDGSAVPQMLLDAMKQLGAALVAMTVEEVNELLADDEGAEPVILIADDMMMESLTDGQRAVIALTRAFAKPAAVAETRDFFEDEIAALKALAGSATKAGKVLSAASKQTLGDAHASITKGCDMIKGMLTEPADDQGADEAKAVRARRAKALRLLADKPKLTGK